MHSYNYWHSRTWFKVVPPSVGPELSRNNTRRGRAARKQGNTGVNLSDIRWTHGGGGANGKGLGYSLDWQWSAQNLANWILKWHRICWTNYSSPLTSTLHPPGITYMMNAPRPSPFTAALPSSCITVNAKQKTNKNGVVLGMRLVYYSTVSYCDPPIYNAMINLIKWVRAEIFKHRRRRLHPRWHKSLEQNMIETMYVWCHTGYREWTCSLLH